LQARREAVPLHGHWKVVPWPEPVDGDSLLRDIYRLVRRYVSCTNDDALAIALWVMFAWAHEVAIHSPILLVTSAEGESGKSTTLGLLGFLAPRALVSVEISKAALFRSIQLWQPSFVIDEFDMVLASPEGNASELRAVINSGHTRGQCVIRCVTDEQRPEPFSTFAPKAIGMIGRRLPPTTLGRSIIIELHRCARGESIERFKHEDDPGLQSLRQRLRRWSMDNIDALRDVAPEIPKELSFRQSDNWRVLLAIADLCSGAEDWNDKARAAAIRLEGASDKQSIGIQLLGDIKRIFDEGGYLTIGSALLVSKLKEDEEGPWVGWGRGKGLTPNSLAVLLGGGGGRGRATRGGFGIRSCDVDIASGSRGKGYKRAQFEGAWARYLPETELSSTEGGE
jgi:putative DNA primase/helicase